MPLHRTIPAAAALALSTALAHPAIAQAADRDCSDFATWEEISYVEDVLAPGPDMASVQ